MNCSLDVIPTTANWIKIILNLCRNLCSRRWLWPDLNLVISLIPLGMWQLEIEFEDGLINFKILFLKAEEVSEFLIFMPKLFHSMILDGEKEFLKKLLTCLYNLLRNDLVTCITFLFFGALERSSCNWYS